MSRPCGYRTISTDEPCAHRVTGRALRCAAGHPQHVRPARQAYVAPMPTAVDYDGLLATLPAVVPADGAAPWELCCSCGGTLEKHVLPTCPRLCEQETLYGLCLIDGCGKRVEADGIGFCTAHLAELRKPITVSVEAKACPVMQPRRGSLSPGHG